MKPILQRRNAYSTSTAPRIWCIGGSDSRAGAGIQADLLTAQDFNVCCATIVSAVTAQSRQAVSAVFPVSNDVFQQQLQSAKEDGLPKIIKIGLLATQDQVDILVAWLKQHPCPIILDPVQISSTGHSLLAENVILDALFPFCELITPNEQELISLNGIEYLTSRGATTLLITGRAIDQEKIIDHFFDIPSNNEFYWYHRFVDSENTHGTGCTLATAIAASLARGYPLLDSITQAIAYIQHGLEFDIVSNTNHSVSHKGWPNNPYYWPVPCRPPTDSENKINHAINYYESDLEFPALIQPLGFYPVVDSLELLNALLENGVRTIQLRIKDIIPEATLYSIVGEAIDCAKQYNAQLFINDHWQIACELNAYGVHLGQEDLDMAELKTIAKAGLRLGISSHGFFEMAYAMAFKPSYIALGHVFSTPTKKMPSQPQGLRRLARYANLLPFTPTVAIGGINQSNAEQVLACGVNGVAVVRAVSESTNISGTVRAFMQIFDRAEVPHNIQLPPSF